MAACRIIVKGKLAEVGAYMIDFYYSFNLVAHVLFPFREWKLDITLIYLRDL